MPPEMLKIGTMVVAFDGFSTRLGQVADHTQDRWGWWNVVRIGDGFEPVALIRPAGALGIGWAVATEDQIKRCLREMERAS